MLLFTLFALWCASSSVHGAVPPVRGKPYYPEETHAQHFEEFKAMHNKQYATPEEEKYRFEIFKSNLHHSNELNAQFKETVYGITKFSDLTTEELVSKYTGLVLDKNRQHGPPPATNFSSVEVPEAFDWREKNVVTKVKDQGLCGSCWAFATIGSLESNYAMKKGQLVEFSEQELVDCDNNDGNNGCDGGNPVLACNYIQSKGEMSEADYPYTASPETCAYTPTKVLTKATDCQNYVGTSEDELKKVLYNKGPMVIGVDARKFHKYQNGILRECKYVGIDHAVLLVGYGTENGVPFWIIKNSWGEHFGEQGYIRIERGNNCLGFNDSNGIILPVEV